MDYFNKSLTNIMVDHGLEILMDGSQEHMQKQVKNKPKFSRPTHKNFIENFAKVTLLGSSWEQKNYNKTFVHDILVD